MTLRPGDCIDAAFWMAGEETSEHLRQFIHDIELAIGAKAKAAGVITGPVKMTVKLPGEPRVPDTPKWLEQKCASIGRRLLEITLKPGETKTFTAPVLLVAEATVMGQAPDYAKRTFVGDLSRKDLERLRKVTKAKVLRTQRRQISDFEADDIIEQIGPDAAYGAVLDQLKAGAVN